jgi:putative membrane protein
MRIRSIATTAAAVGLLAALPTAGWAKAYKHRTTPNVGAEKFIKEAATGGMAEVQLGSLAEQKASRDDVKAFGKRMVTDHTKVNDDLKSLASQKNVTVPSDLDAKHKAVYDRLSKLSGTQFDRAYVDEMLKDHREDVAAFKREARSSDPDVKDFASRTLPTLQDHLSHVETLASGGTASETHGSRSHRPR